MLKFGIIIRNKYTKMQIKSALKTMLQFSMVMSIIFVLTHLQAFAAPLLPFTTGEYQNVPRPPEGLSGQKTITALALGVLRYVKILMGVVGILFISIQGFRIVIAEGEEEKVNTMRTGLVYTVIALVIVSMAEDLARIFDMTDSVLLSTPQDVLERARLFDKQVEIIMTFIKYSLGAFATLMVVRSALSLVAAGGDEEETTKHKKGIMYSGGGLALIYVGQIFVEKVFYKIDKQVYSGITGVHPGVDTKVGVEQIAGITSMVVKVVGPIAVLMIIGGAIMYATAGADEEQTNQAKRLVAAAVVGIIVIYGSFAVVSTVISSQLTQLGAIGT